MHHNWTKRAHSKAAALLTVLGLLTGCVFGLLPGATAAAGTKPAAPAATGGYTALDLGPIDQSYDWHHEGNSVYPVGVSRTGAVLFPFAGLLSGGKYLKPSNDIGGNGDGALDFIGLNDSNTAIGNVLQGSTQFVAVWSGAAGTPYQLLDFAAVRAALPAGSVIKGNSAISIDDSGHIFGSLAYQLADGSPRGDYFVADAATAKAALATDPRGGTGQISIYGLNYPWEAFSDGKSPQRYNLQTKTDYPAYSFGSIAANGTLLIGSETLNYLDGTRKLLDAPAGDDSVAAAIADDGSTAGTYYNSTYTVGRPAFWDSTGALTDLDDATGLSLNAATIGHSGSLLGWTVGTGAEVYLLKAGANPPPVVDSTGDKGAISNGTKGCDTGSTVTIGGKVTPECTLRAAIQAENAHSVDARTISFLPSLVTGGRAQLDALSALPAVTAAGITLDFGSAGAPVLLTPAFDPGSTAAGLDIKAADVTIAGLYAVNWPRAVLLEAPGHDTVTGSSLGRSAVAPDNTNTVGIELRNSGNNLIGGGTTAEANVLSGDDIGVYVNGSNASNNRVQGNVIGASADGLTADPAEIGVWVRDGSNNTIGGVTATPGTGLGNLIQAGRSGNGSGVVVDGIAAKATGNIVQGNTLGLDRTGAASFAGACEVELAVSGSTLDTRIGSNVISGQCRSEVSIDSTLSDGTSLLGNKIGTDLTGNHQVAVGSADFGIRVEGATHTTLGQPGQGNVVVGFPVGITGTKQSEKTTVSFPAPVPVPGSDSTLKGDTSTVIAGNTIGVLADGHTIAKAAARYGILLTGGRDLVRGNLVGGAAFGVAVNAATGVETVDGNKLGVDATGLRALDNVIDVAVTGSKHAVIGSTARPNVLYGHGIGVDVEKSPSTVVRGNHIGVTPTGDAVVAPYPGTLPAGIAEAEQAIARSGIAIDAASSAVQVEQNVVGGLLGDGIDVAAAKATELSGNHVGVGQNASSDVGNAGNGIVLAGGTEPVIGATLASSNTAVSGAGNLVAFNHGIGIHLIAITHPRLLSDLAWSNAGGELVVTGVHPDTPTAPQLELARNAGGHTIVTVQVGEHGDGLVQLFLASSCSANTAGRQLLDSRRIGYDLRTNDGSEDVTLPTLPVGSNLIATVTDPATGTSAVTGCAEVHPSAGSPSVAKPSIAPGGTQTVQGSGFAPGEAVQATLHSSPIDLGEHLADAGGRVSFSFTVPAGLAAGVHRVILLGLSSGRAGEVSFTVTGAVRSEPIGTPSGNASTAGGPASGSSASGGSLASTGMDVRDLFDAGLLILLVGLLLLLGQRRNQSLRSSFQNARRSIGW